MYHKSFTSLSISEHKVKIVRLSNDRKKVTKFATYEVPKGLISQGKVQKEEELSKIIKDIWEKEKIRDKTVGLIIPEFSTFMKSLSLPKLPFSELDEAVRWQAREFLPQKADDMVLDWKIIDKSDTEYEVLTVAIEKNELFGYVGAVSKAGLFPLLVETPSLSLERLANAKDKGKLVMYRSKGVLVVSVVVGEKILASSVLSVHDEDLLLKSIVQIEARFGKGVIEKISVCGNGLTQEFLTVLSHKFSLPIELLSPKILGFTDYQIQDYVIAISQQLAEVEEPSSENSINLLPSVWVNHYKNQIRDLRAWTITLVGSVCFWSCLIATLAAYIYLSQQASVFANKKPKEADLDSKSVVAEVSQINKVTSKINKITSAFVYPQEIVNTINKQKTEGITIKEYLVNTETKSVTIRGISDTRQHLIDFKNSLDSRFISVTLPLSALLTETNITYEMNFGYKK